MTPVWKLLGFDSPIKAAEILYGHGFNSLPNYPNITPTEPSYHLDIIDYPTETAYLYVWAGSKRMHFYYEDQKLVHVLVPSNSMVTI